VKLLKLKLENFRQFRAAEVEFGNGMTAIVGVNGAGKTTLLEAISFALFGVQRETMDTVRSYWPSPNGKFAVTLTFQLGEQEFELLRGETKAHLKEITGGAENVWATGKSEVSKRTARLLNLTYPRFKNSFCAEQKDLKFLNFGSNADIQQEIIRMLGYDRLELAELKAVEERKGARQLAGYIRSSLKDQAELQRRLSEADSEWKATEAAISEAHKNRAKLAADLAPADVRRLKAEQHLQASILMSDLASKADGLKAAVAMAEAAFERNQKEAQERQTLEADEQSYVQTAEEMRECEALREREVERDRLVKDETRLLSEVAVVAQRLANMPKPDIEELRKLVSAAQAAKDNAELAVKGEETKWQEAKQSAIAEHSTAQARAQELGIQLRKAESMLAKGICPECGQPLSAWVSEGVDRRRSEAIAADTAAREAGARRKALEETPAEVAKLRAAVLAAGSAAIDRDRDLQAAVIQMSKIEGEERQRDARLKELEEVRARIAAIPPLYDARRHSALKARLSELEPRHLRFLELAGVDQRLREFTLEREKARADLETAKRQYGSAKEQRASYGFANDDAAKDALLYHQSLARDMARLDAEIEGKVKLAARCRLSRESVQREIEEQKAQVAALAAQEKLDLLADVVAKQMRLLREGISKQIVPELAARASENLSLFTAGRYLQLKLDERTFRPSIIDGDTEKRVISGGEEDIVALALRLALSELIQERQGRPMSLLILDEVFGSLDQERRQNLLDRLVAIRDRFQQILVISHIEDINQVADRCIYVRHDPEGHCSVVSDAPSF
jgi:exonuclease SbcC